MFLLPTYNRKTKLVSRIPTGPGTTISQPLIQNIRHGSTPGTRKLAKN